MSYTNYEGSAPRPLRDKAQILSLMLAPAIKRETSPAFGIGKLPTHCGLRPCRLIERL
jgi:hypothetical protein